MGFESQTFDYDLECLKRLYAAILRRALHDLALFQETFGGRKCASDCIPTGVMLIEEAYSLLRWFRGTDTGVGVSLDDVCFLLGIPVRVVQRHTAEQRRVLLITVKESRKNLPRRDYKRSTKEKSDA